MYGCAPQAQNLASDMKEKALKHVSLRLGCVLAASLLAAACSSDNNNNNNPDAAPPS